MKKSPMDKVAMLNALSRIMELELAAAVPCTHYALMVRGFNRLPIAAWLKKQAEDELVTAREAGEPLAWLCGQPSLSIGPLPAAARQDIGDILCESPDQERDALTAYYDLLDLSKDNNVRLEAYARDMIAREFARQDEANRMSMKRFDYGQGTPGARLELCR